MLAAAPRPNPTTERAASLPRKRKGHLCRISVSLDRLRLPSPSKFPLNSKPFPLCSSFTYFALKPTTVRVYEITDGENYYNTTPWEKSTNSAIGRFTLSSPIALTFISVRIHIKKGRRGVPFAPFNPCKQSPPFSGSRHEEFCG